MKKITFLAIFTMGIYNIASAQVSNYTAEVPGTTSASFDLKNSQGFWHLSGPRSFEANNNLSVFWNSGGVFKRYLTLSDNGNFGIGTSNPNYKLHLVNNSTSSGTAFRADALNGHIRLFETDGSNPSTHFTQIERNGNAFHIFQNDGTGYQQVFTANMNGNVGLGTTNPTAGLHILNNESSSVLIQTVGVNNADLVFQSGTNQSDIVIKNAAGSLRSLLRFNEDADGATLSFQNRIGGIADEFLKISGKGIVYAKEIVVQTTAFPDYVFNEEYKLMPITEVESYIKNEGHLPNVPCARDIETNGLTIGDMQVVQMEKIEELTLYIIQLEKKLQAQAELMDIILNQKAKKDGKDNK